MNDVTSYVVSAVKVESEDAWKAKVQSNGALFFILTTGCPRKNATNLNNSSCFILVSKQLFLLKSAIIRINLIYFPVFLVTWF